jgi:hypothetical protein
MQIFSLSILILTTVGGCKATNHRPNPLQCPHRNRRAETCGINRAVCDGLVVANRSARSAFVSLGVPVPLRRARPWIRIAFPCVVVLPLTNQFGFNSEFGGDLCGLHRTATVAPYLKCFLAIMALLPRHYIVTPPPSFQIQIKGRSFRPPIDSLICFFIKRRGNDF